VTAVVETVCSWVSFPVNDVSITSVYQIIPEPTILHRPPRCLFPVDNKNEERNTQSAQIQAMHYSVFPSDLLYHAALSLYITIVSRD
jgi:hypothetical protein